MMSRAAKPRVLFFAEPATLAHVARPVVLARALPASRYDVFFATGPDYWELPSKAGLSCIPLWSIGTRAYLDAVVHGRPVFPYSILERYVANDLKWISEIRPELIVGDFRLSLAVSARLAKVPYFSITNAYWSPAAGAQFEVPVHALSKKLGPRTANRLFQPMRPAFWAYHSLPMFRVRRRHGFARTSAELDFCRVVTESDMTLFADVPEMVRVPENAPPHRYLGPIVWSPEMTLPDSLRATGDTKPLVYITMGSSGNQSMISSIIDTCEQLGCRIVVATGGKGSSVLRNDSITVVPYLPGDQVAAMASLVVCNGGSPSAHQALAQGTPVLGIPSNLDQILNMQFVVTSGAGLSLREDCVSPIRLREHLTRLLHEGHFRMAARRIAQQFARYSAPERFRTIVDRTLSSQPSETGLWYRRSLG